MRYTYRLTNDTDGITATCVEMSASATGPSSAEAVTALRDAIYERLTHVEAVAPPESVPVPSIELVPARDPAPEPQGPGDAPAAERASVPAPGDAERASVPKAPGDGAERAPEPQGPGDSPAADRPSASRSH